MLQRIDTYKLVADRAADAIFVVDNDGRIHYANPAAEKIFGYAAQEYAGKIIHDLLTQRSANGNVVRSGEFSTLHSCTSDEASGASSVVSVVLSRKDGSSVAMSCSASPVRTGGKKIGLVLMMRDVTGIHGSGAVADAFHKSHETLRLAVEAANLGLWDYYPQTGELAWSDTKKRLFGIAAKQEVTYDTFVQLIHPDDRERVQTALQQVMTRDSDGRLEMEFRAVHPSDNRERWYKSYGKSLRDAQGRSIRLIGVTLDITQSKFAERRILEASQHDPLTGLPNRATLFEYCRHMLATAKRTRQSVALLFIDLDRFKPINDTYGHDVGDHVLRQMAKRLVACIREEDIVGRLGGDEFVVAIRDPDDVHTPATVAQHIIGVVSEPYHVGQLQLHVSPSIGISLYPQHSASLDALIQYADLAMYAAKKAGRKRYKFYTPSSDESAGERQSSIEMRLKYAVENNELALHYQPVLELDSGRVAGVEALLRVPVPDGVPLVPEQFLSIAEAAGLADRLGEWVVREACRQHLQWRNAGLPGLIIAINLSLQQFQHHSILPHLADCLVRSGMDPSCLQVELKEAMVIENAREMQAALEEIRALGIGIALDDFGTGFCSVGLLSSLPLDKLKIDQSLTGRLAHDIKCQTIIGSILALGKSLKLKVVGEGIESEASCDYLRAHGCDQAQGYYFSKPLSADAFERWYRGIQLQQGPAN